MPEPLAGAVLEKILEQVDRIEHLIEALPPGGLEWAPPIEGAWTTSQLIEHLGECLSGFCAALHAAEPERLAQLKEVATGTHALSVLADHIAAAFQLVDDAALARTIPTIFVPEGELLLTILLGNLEHLINHKHQLFVHLKLMCVPVETKDLYCFH